MSNLPNIAAAASTKIQIEQNVPSGSIRKGPYAIERSVDPNNVVIKRRFGEGSTPLFQRDDIAINHKQPAETNSSIPQACDNLKAESVHQWHNNKCRRSSTNSSSPERYHKYNNARTPTDTDQSHYHRHNEASPKPNINLRQRISAPPSRDRTTEKVPYFVDEVRERDRVLRIYGSGSRGKTPPPTKQPTRRYAQSRSRSHSPSPTKRRVQPQHRNTSSSSYRARSNSRDRYRMQTSSKRHSSHGAWRRYSRTPERRSSRSLDHRRGSRERRYYSAGRLANVHWRHSDRSHSPTRSPERARCTRDSRNGGRRYDHLIAHEPSVQTAPQIITIPVPVPADYAYGYSAWPPPPQWGPGAIPPPRYASYPMPTMLPAPVMPTLRPPPPYGMPPYYGGHMFRPQQPRYGFARPPRANHRPRNY